MGFGSLLKDKLQVCYDTMDKFRVDLEGDLLDKFIHLESKVENNLEKFETKLEKELKEMRFNIERIDEHLM